jgi:hypothetical protein
MGLTTLSEEELMGIEGNVVTSASDGASPLTLREMRELGWIKFIEVSGGIYVGCLLGAKITVSIDSDGIITVTVETLTLSATVSGTEVGIESTLISLGFNQNIVNKVTQTLHKL